MIKLLNKIIENPINQKVLKFLEIDTLSKELYLTCWEKSQNGFEEGACKLLNKLTKNIPTKCKYSFEHHSIIIIPVSGEIIAFNTGRYSLFTKCDFENFGLKNNDSYRKGYTFDCIKDITELGDEWAFIDNFDEDIEDKVTEQYYEKITGANNGYK